MFSNDNKQQIEIRFEQLLPHIGDKKDEILEELKQCSNEEVITMKFLYTSMPLSDIGNHEKGSSDILKASKIISNAN